MRVKIAASSLCHTDWETMRGYQWELFNLPAITGHEGPGTVHVKEGDHGQPIVFEIAREATASGVLFDGTTRMSRNGETVTTTALFRSTPSTI